MADIPDIEFIKVVIEIIKHADIDIEETISRAKKVGWMASDYIVWGGNDTPLPRLFELNGFEYDPFEDSYWEGINKLIDEMGVYIVLAYVTEGEESYSAFKYNTDGLDKEEICYADISVGSTNIDFELSEDSPATRNIDLRDDYGILLTREEGKLEINFAYNEYNPAGPCGYNSIREIEDEIENPVFRLVIVMMLGAIVLKDKSTGFDLLTETLKKLSNKYD